MWLEELIKRIEKNDSVLSGYDSLSESEKHAYSVALHLALSKIRGNKLSELRPELEAMALISPKNMEFLALIPISALVEGGLTFSIELSNKISKTCKKNYEIIELFEGFAETLSNDFPERMITRENTEWISSKMGVLLFRISSYLLNNNRLDDAIEYLKTAKFLAPSQPRIGEILETAKQIKAKMDGGTEIESDVVKPKVLLIADVPNWIFARHCNYIKRFLSNDFEFTLIYLGADFEEDDYDLIYPLEWNYVKKEKIKNPKKYVTGIRSHLYWTDEDFFSFVNFLTTKFSVVHAVSKRLYDVFKPFTPNIVNISHGIESSFFNPTTTADLSGNKLKIGWAGNRKSAAKKGFAEFIEPLEKLDGVEIFYYGYSDKNLTMEEMREFYNSIDVYVCASDFEGNNNSLMEAAVMGRAIITTNSGTVPEYLVDGENALIVERQLANFIYATMKLRDNPKLRAKLGAAARKAALAKWEWYERAEDYRAMFWTALAKSGYQIDKEVTLLKLNHPVEYFISL